MNSETFLENKKNKKQEKKNTQRTLLPGHTFRLVPANCTKNLQHFIFSVPFFVASFV